MDNLARPVYFVGAGVLCFPCGGPYPCSSGHRPDRTDRTIIAGTEDPLAENTPKKEAGGHFLKEQLRGSPSFDLIEKEPPPA